MIELEIKLGLSASKALLFNLCSSLPSLAVTLQVTREAFGVGNTSLEKVLFVFLQTLFYINYFKDDLVHFGQTFARAADVSCSGKAFGDAHFLLKALRCFFHINQLFTYFQNQKYSATLFFPSQQHIFTL